MHVDLARLDVGVLLRNDVGGLVPGLTGRLVPGHHAFESRAVLGVVHALRIAFVELRPRVPRGLRARTTPPRSAGGWHLRDGRRAAVRTLRYPASHGRMSTVAAQEDQR